MFFLCFSRNPCFPNVEYSEELKILIAREVSGRSLFRYDVSAIIVGIVSLCAQFDRTNARAAHRLYRTRNPIENRCDCTKRREETFEIRKRQAAKAGSSVVTRKNNASANLERTYVSRRRAQLVAYLETLSYFANIKEKFWRGLFLRTSCRTHTRTSILLD